jgi:dipeptidyl aminopeptidase/acylaminoacyl peptidase
MNDMEDAHMPDLAPTVGTRLVASGQDMPAGQGWARRFDFGPRTLPKFAARNPDRAAFLATVHGATRLYAWNRRTGEQHQLTAQRPARWAMEPSGTWVWWFDAGADERGIWRRTRFVGGPAEVALPTSPAMTAGLAFGPGNSVAVGLHDGTNSVILRALAGQPGVPLYLSPDAYLMGGTTDGTLLAVAETPTTPGGPWTRVLQASDGAILSDVLPETGRTYPLAFGPEGAYGHHLLCLHEHRGKPEPMIWDADTGNMIPILLELPGEIRVDWYPDGSGLLVAHLYQARSEIFWYAFCTGELRPLGTPRGFVHDASACPDGSVDYIWSSSARPPVFRSTSTSPLPVRGTHLDDAQSVPAAIACEDLWVSRAGQFVHSLVTRPMTGEPPFPTVFLLHGGPAVHDADSFNPVAAAWAENGFCVIRINYRGSTGYGTAWRDATIGRVGLTELEDLAAVRDAVVGSRLAIEHRIALVGASWGGYLALLGIGTMPRAWAACVAESPIADYAMAYEDEPERLRAWDRAHFGGDPRSMPIRYKESSPITYSRQVRAPVLLITGQHDPRCSRRQILAYVQALAAAGTRCDVVEHDQGHGVGTAAGRVRLITRELEFVRRQLGIGGDEHFYRPGATS